MNIQIVDMTHELVHSVYEIEKQAFTNPWSEKSFYDEINNPVAIYFVAIKGVECVGYIGMWEVCGQADITNVAVLPAHRREGIASSLIRHLANYCKQKQLSHITLEVRETNEAAKALYKSLGFKPIGHRKRYYSDTGEDAVIMSLNI